MRAIFIKRVHLCGENMVEGRLRSRTFRRVKRRTPGNKTVLHYIRRKPGFAECGACGTRLKGIPRGLPRELMNLPKTAKRPERPDVGVLCSSCMRERIIANVRKGVATVV